MNTYQVTITETLTKIVEVKAKTAWNAEQQVSDNWGKCEYILNADNFSGVTFEAVSKAESSAESGFAYNQLYDYIANWQCLMKNNHHLKENERIRVERQKVLSDVCACIMQLEKAAEEIAALKAKLNKPS